MTCERAAVGQVCNIWADESMANESNLNHLQPADHQNTSFVDPSLGVSLVDPSPSAPVQQAQHVVRVPVVLQVSSCMRASLRLGAGQSQEILSLTPHV